MSIKIRLIDDKTLVVHADADQWTRAFERALELDHVIEVHGDGGRTLAVNPHQVLFWEAIPEETEAKEPQGPGVPQAQAVA